MEEQPIQRDKIILAYDEELIRELEDTTEIATPAGYTRYLPAVRGRDHNTDALRCVMAAIHKFATIRQGLGEFDASEFGWVDRGGSGREWVPPWTM